MKSGIVLESDRIVRTIERLGKRISDRFPESDLRKVVHQFLKIAGESNKNIEWISKPNMSIRFFSYFVILLGVAAIIYSFTIATTLLLSGCGTSAPQVGGGRI